MILIFSCCIAFLGVVCAALGLRAGRHGTKFYENQNAGQQEKRHDDQVLANAVLLGVKGVRGVPDQPSIAERFDCLDQKVTDISEVVVHMDKELHPNGGMSMRDDLTAVRRIAETALAAIQNVNPPT